jgi:F-type H+-transporting ATPase subunit b
VEQAKGAATTAGARIVAAAQQQIELDTTRARESLRREVAGIAVGAAAKLLGREIDPRAHADLLNNLAAQI